MRQKGLSISRITACIVIELIWKTWINIDKDIHLKRKKMLMMISRLFQRMMEVGEAGGCDV
jgi:hypothetical protein